MSTNFSGLENLCIGDRLGSGQTRDVFYWQPDDSLVIKVAKDYYGIAANIREFDLYCDAVSGEFYESLNYWLAPIESISTCGRFMLMKKTEPVRLEDAPTVIPTWMTDLKLDNIGWFEGRVVTHDYGLNLIVEDALSVSKHKAKIVKRESWIK